MHYINQGVVMNIRKGISLFLALLVFQSIYPHGFGGGCLVKDASGLHWQIENIVKYIETGQNLQVLSFNEFERTFTAKKVKSVGFCESQYYCRLFFNQDQHSLECTPLQLFYRVTDRVWVAASKLKIGDRLLCAGNKTVEVCAVDLFHEKLKVYTLEVKGTHTFLVTPYNIIAHNMLLPCGAVAGLAIPLDIGCGASIGTMFGPVGICTGIVVGGVVGCIVNACIKNRVVEYKLSFKAEVSDNLCHFAKSVDDILKDTIPGRETKGRARQYIKKGGYSDAVKDFEDLGPIDIQKMKDKKGWVGTLPDGRMVVVREQSKDGRPTLEIQQPENKGRVIKIRYDKK